MKVINAGAAQATATGAGVKVGVIDGGVDFTHPDLAGGIDVATSCSFIYSTTPTADPAEIANGDCSNKAAVQDLPCHGTHVATDGAVTGAEIGDLNADGSPEIYVYTNSAGSGAYGSLVAYAPNNCKSLSEIYLPPVTDDAAAGRGYMGHDEFTLGEGALLRRFPVYKEGDTNAQATGGSRQLQYELEAGEAGWVLRLDKFDEF